MAEVIPFKGVLYNPQMVNPNLVMSPPYDVISPELKEELYRRSAFNIIRVDFGKDNDGDNEKHNRYTRASWFLSDWLREGVLVQDAYPCFYCYEIQYTLGGEHRNMKGFFGAVRIEELGKGSVHPHEMTYAKPKSDRLHMLRSCLANTSPIYSLYSCRKNVLSSILDDVSHQPPHMESHDRDGFIHRLWKITDRDAIDTIKKEMADKDIYIADGHHRYETALAFRKEMEEKHKTNTGEEPFHFALMFLTNMDEEGVTLLPTHRMIEINSDIRIKETLGKYFDIQRIDLAEFDEKALRDRMFEVMRGRDHTFGMLLTDANVYYTLSYNSTEFDVDLPDCLKSLDVSILHKFVFEKLLHVEHFAYEMDPDIAVKRSRKDSFEAVFFLNPTKIEDVKNVALAGQRMPPKSTYFYPKLLTGMVLYSF